MVRVERLELPTSCSQSRRATNCATPGYGIFQLWSNMWSTPIFDQLPARGKVLSAQLSQGFPGFPMAAARTWASRSQSGCTTPRDDFVSPFYQKVLPMRTAFPYFFESALRNLCVAGTVASDIRSRWSFLQCML